MGGLNGGRRSRHELHLVAVDYGSSSGRVVLGSWDGGRLAMREVHRFHHRPLEHAGRLVWDAAALAEGLRDGIGAVQAAARRHGGRCVCAAISTWGVDYGWVEPTGRLVGQLSCHRDPGVARGAALLDRLIGAQRMFELTGAAPSPITTAAQIAANPPPVAARLMLLPDLFAHLLTGQFGASQAIASTSGLTRPGGALWHPELVEAVGIDPERLPPISPELTAVGELDPNLPACHGLEPLTVVRAGTHDTAAATHAALLAGAANTMVASCGSWSVLSVPADKPVLGEAALRAGLTNEARVDGGIRVTRNLTGLWMIQQTQRQLEREHTNADLGELLAQAAAVPAGRALIDVDDPVYATVGDLPAAIRAAARRDHHTELDTPGAVVRVILESLAHAYLEVATNLEHVTGRTVDTIRLIGGGAHNHLLCQLVADITRRPVQAGPAEATSLGNLLAQLAAIDQVTAAEAHEIALATSRPRAYLPCAV
ncbi:MAG: hypothetical protein LBD97_09765 [Bifidobacteriaceae bacterium]|jgi:rhamnulokinase|nr:hypothetical protein [Bifidobacteriaceae bacterium]